eukprot:TRINITY_DN17208_c0_g1_i1.p1 TRINITY_DN17208_c0_g1~~TRINITY_DN17208_c0_g1_i1.p1  ORF type:complete len:288 (-),score=63.80 TRINITY_DN17208_c0_g1_i1:72-935(-)
MNVQRFVLRVNAATKSIRCYTRVYHGTRKVHPKDNTPSGIKWLAFDIETSSFVNTEFQANKDYQTFSSPGIACVATLSSDGEKKLFYSGAGTGIVNEKLSTEDCKEVIQHLKDSVKAGYSIVTWNGTGFDFPILAQEVPSLESDIQELALHHIDIMFLLFCMKGFPLSMEAAAKGMGISGAKTIMKSEDVPKMWNSGKKQEVIDYVSEDVKVTIELAEKIARRKEITWQSKSGHPVTLPIPEVRLVKDCQELPLPDVSWMKVSIPREAYIGWCTKDSVDKQEEKAKE